MKNFEKNLKRCEQILKATADLEGTNLNNKSHSLIYNDGESDALVIRNYDSGDAVVGLMNGPDQISCYEFDASGAFNHFEPMTRKDMAWALPAELID